MDWKNEKEKLVEAVDRNYWKPTPGQHKIKFLSDGEEYEFDIEEKGVTKKVKKVGFKIKVNGEEEVFDWGVSKGITAQGLYGQLTLVGEWKGSLVDQEINLVVKGTGKTVEYTVLEALSLMKPKEEKVE